MNGILFIGLQGSGKSTFFLQQFYKTHLRLSMDMLRTRHREKLLFEACLAAKQPVVIDNTNPTKADRARYICAFRAHQFEVIAYYFDVPFADCVAHNALRTGKECVPEVGIKSVAKQLQLPTLDEGFDAIYRVQIQNQQFIISVFGESS
ncbi:MAG TPA: ATP-binding protein [Thiolinea sp.]|nr:ATP-binding protein [Thiolinea sp.]